MKVLILRVGRGREAWADEAVEAYARRLRSRMPVEERRLKPEPFRGDVERVREAEGARVLAVLRPGDRLVALDERGEQLTTEQLARLIDDAARRSAGRLVFALGGPYGHAEAVRRRADRVVALSRLVLNHEVARVVLAEQLYRAGTILWGGKYHH